MERFYFTADVLRSFVFSWQLLVCFCGEPHFRELEPAGGLAAAGRGTADGGMMPCILTGAPDVLTLRLSET
jgi:hypothetical protein